MNRGKNKAIPISPPTPLCVCVLGEDGGGGQYLKESNEWPKFGIDLCSPLFWGTAGNLD